MQQNCEEKLQTNETKEDKDNDNNSKSLYKLVNIDFVYNGIQGNDPVTLIDLRTSEEFTKCHINKAFNVSIETSSLHPINITNVSQLICSDPPKLKVVYGRLVILYANSNTDPKCYDFILDLIDKQNCGNFQYFVMSKEFNDFKTKYPYLCIYDKETIKTSKEALFDQSYIENDGKKQLEESNISAYKRYQQTMNVESGYPNIITDNLLLGNGRQAMNWSVVYNLNITHIVNMSRLIPNQFDGNTDLQTVVPIISVLDHFNKHPVKYLKCKVLDIESESLTSRFETIFNFMDNALNENNGNNNNKVFIHCQQGISRSSTVLIAYLMHSKKWLLVDSYQYVKRRRRRICPNKGFLKQLMEFEKRLFNGKSTVNEIGERGIRDLTQFNKFLKGTHRKRRNESQMLKDSVAAFFSQKEQQNK